MSSKQRGGKRPFAGRIGFAYNKPECTPSRKKYKCPVCGTVKRSDKLHEHINNLCRFETNGRPVRLNSNEFKNFSQEAKAHIKYCHEKNITKAIVESWKTLIPENLDDGFETSYFKKWKKSECGENTESPLTSSHIENVCDTGAFIRLSIFNIIHIVQLHFINYNLL